MNKKIPTCLGLIALMSALNVFAQGKIYIEGATSSQTAINERVNLEIAKNQRIGIIGDNIVKYAEAELKKTEANKVATETLATRQRVVFLEELIRVMKEDMKYLDYTHQKINKINSSICRATYYANATKRDGRLFTGGIISYKRLQAVMQLLTVDTLDHPIEESIDRAMATFIGKAGFENIVDQNGLIFAAEINGNEEFGLIGKKSFHVSSMTKKLMSNGRIPFKRMVGFEGGSFFDLISFMETYRLDFKKLSKAHRIFNRVIAEIEKNAHENISANIDSFILPTRKRILDFWTEFQLRNANVTSNSNIPSASGSIKFPVIDD